MQPIQIISLTNTDWLHKEWLVLFLTGLALLVLLFIPIGRLGQFGKIADLARKNLRKDWWLLLCLVLSLAAVTAPLMLLYSLKEGVVETKRQELRQNPRVLEVQTDLKTEEGSNSSFWTPERRKILQSKLDRIPAPSDREENLSPWSAPTVHGVQGLTLSTVYARVFHLTNKKEQANQPLVTLEISPSEDGDAMIQKGVGGNWVIDGDTQHEEVDENIPKAVISHAAAIALFGKDAVESKHLEDTYIKLYGQLDDGNVMKGKLSLGILSVRILSDIGEKTSDPLRLFVHQNWQDDLLRFYDHRPLSKTRHWKRSESPPPTPKLAPVAHYDGIEVIWKDGMKPDWSKAEKNGYSVEDIEEPSLGSLKRTLLKKKGGINLTAKETELTNITKELGEKNILSLGWWVEGQKLPNDSFLHCASWISLLNPKTTQKSEKNPHRIASIPAWMWTPVTSKADYSELIPLYWEIQEEAVFSTEADPQKKFPVSSRFIPLADGKYQKDGDPPRVGLLVKPLTAPASTVLEWVAEMATTLPLKDISNVKGQDQISELGTLTLPKGTIIRQAGTNYFLEATAEDQSQAAKTKKSYSDKVEGQTSLSLNQGDIKGIILQPKGTVYTTAANKFWHKLEKNIVHLKLPVTSLESEKWKYSTPTMPEPKGEWVLAEASLVQKTNEMPAYTGYATPIASLLYTKPETLAKFRQEREFKAYQEAQQTVQKDDAQENIMAEDDNKEVSYERLRICACDMDQVESIVTLLQNDYKIQPESSSVEIHSMKTLEQSLGKLFQIVMYAAAGGAAVAFFFSLWSSVDRKRKDLAILRLLGFSKGWLFFFPMVQAVIAAVMAFGLSWFMCWLANNQFLAGTAESLKLAKGELTRMTITDYAYFAGAMLSLSILLAMITGIRMMRIEPAEGLREE